MLISFFGIVESIKIRTRVSERLVTLVGAAGARQEAHEVARGQLVLVLGVAQGWRAGQDEQPLLFDSLVSRFSYA